jgi:SAM-dependent methyltransferase
VSSSSEIAPARPPRRKLRAWAAGNPGNQAIRTEATEVLTRLAATPLAGEEPVVDVGCGTGWWLERLADAGVVRTRLYGVELDRARVAAARTRAPGATVEHADARKLGWPDASFAAAFLLLVLSSAGDRRSVARVLSETRRVVRPGGLVLIWEPAIVTPGRGTRFIGRGELRAGLGGAEIACEPLTVFPPLARQLDGSAYERLAKVRPLLTHRVLAYRR